MVLFTVIGTEFGFLGMWSGGRLTCCHSYTLQDIYYVFSLVHVCPLFSSNNLYTKEVFGLSQVLYGILTIQEAYHLLNNVIVGSCDPYIIHIYDDVSNVITFSLEKQAMIVMKLIKFDPF